MSEADWAAIRPNLEAVAEAADWWEILHGHVARAAAEEDRDFLARAAEAAGEIDWSEAPWPQLVARLKAERSGKSLFHPLAPGADRARQRAGNGGAAAADRARGGGVAAAGGGLH